MIKLIISILTVVKYIILNIYQQICPFILILNRNIFTFTTCLELPTSSEKGNSDKYIKPTSHCTILPTIVYDVPSYDKS